MEPKVILVERIAVALETIDRRVAHIERDTADVSAFSEQLSENTERIMESNQNLSVNYEKLVTLFAEQNDRMDRIEGMLANYVEATQGLRRDTLRLQSEVREKLKAV